MPQLDIKSIYDAAWTQATLAQMNATSVANSAGAALTPQGAVTYTMTDPSATPITDRVDETLTALTSSTGDVRTTYDGVAQALEARLASYFTEFLAAHFPVSDLASTQAWLNTQIEQGGAGINVTVERAIWQRDVDRLQLAAQQATNDLLSTFSNRRYPMPPGAAAHQAAQIQRDTMAKIGDSSRERAIKTWDAELDLLKFAVTTNIALHNSAVQLTGDYVRLMALGPQTGVQMASIEPEARAKAVQAAASYYGAQVGLLDTKTRLELGKGGLSLDASKTAYGTTTTLHSRRADLTIETARMMATLAAAALNGAQVNFAYAEQRDVTGTA